MNFRVDINIVGNDSSIARSSFKPDALKMACQSLDVPSSNSDNFDKLLCSDEALIAVVKFDRYDLSVEIAAALTEAVMKELEKNDTLMGYKVEIE